MGFKQTNNKIIMLNCMGFKQIKTESNFKKAIMEVIAFFDLFDFPLTDFEVWKFIGVECDLADVKNLLSAEQEAELPIGSSASSEGNFYFLRGRENIVGIRQKRNIFTERKFKRARLIARIFKFIPWIKMIAVSNIIGERNLKDESDIDLFIITENSKIWLTRFFCAGIAKVSGLRPKKGNERDKICLNFYVSEEAMDVSGLMLKENSRGIESKTLRFPAGNRSVLDSFCGDIYFKYWLVNLAPIYDVGDVYKNFIQANDWIKKYFPNWRLEKNSGRVLKNKPSKFNLLNLFFSRMERYVKKLQLKMMPAEMREMMNKDTRVVVNDKVLKLHVNDRRLECQDKFYKKMNAITMKQ